MTVYRHDDFAFPPARGRRGVEFRPDGTFSELLIGRGDAPEAAAAGRWSAAGTLMRSTQSAGVIVRAEPDRLEIVWE